MSFDYTGLENTAESLISKFGRDVSIRAITKSGTAYNPTITETDTTVKAVGLNFKDSEIDGTLIRKGDIKYLIKTSMSIDETNQIVDQSVIWSIISSEEVKPGGTRIIYKIHARLKDTA